MSLFSLFGTRRRSQPDCSALGFQSQSPGSSPDWAIQPLSPSSPKRARNRLRKRPKVESPLVETPSRPSPPRIQTSGCSRGTLGGFCGLEELDVHQATNPVEKDSVMRTVGRKIGLGLRLQNDSPTDLTHMVGGTESWYLEFPQSIPIFPEASVESIKVEPVVVIESQVVEEDDGSSILSSSSAYSSIYSLSDDDSFHEMEPMENLILSAQHLAEQYRGLLSRQPTPGPCLLDVTLHRSDTLTPLPLQLSQGRKGSRSKRRLSQKKAPYIPPRQHAKVDSSQRTIRKVQARHSLHKLINIAEYEQILKSSRLSECSTLVSSKENTPFSSPHVRVDELDPFPQIFPRDKANRNKTPEIPPRSQKRPPNTPTYTQNGPWLRVPCAIYDYLGPNARIDGIVNHGNEIWI